MSLLVGIHSLSKSYGTQRLFENISFSLSAGDKVGLIGPNGAGKSSLLKILMNIENPDSGNVSKRQGLRIGYASQFPEFPSLPLEEFLVQQIPHGDEHDLLTKARILLGKALFPDFNQIASSLSGGWKKRLDIVRAMMSDPELLLLDEPTNHLDLEGIIWLEKFLARERIACLIVSHDRYFLENVSNRVIELNKCFPQGLFMSNGNMSDFMTHKEAFLQGQAQEERALRSTVRDEIEWLRKSPKARTTKSRSRIQRAYELIDELSDIKQRNTSRTVGIDFSASDRQSRKLLTTKNLTKTIVEKPLFKGVEITLSPGTRLGIVGKNGSGKTTLLKVLAGMIPQDMGTIKYADDLKLVYFDQHREHIPPDISLKEALSPNSDIVNYRGQSIHVNGWAKKFLFSTSRMELPVRCFSGGERARILIARLMLQPADILFLDEPTNDLDIPTLEVIEESLQEFPGAVVMISHDRCLMERVCTQILVLGEGSEPQFFADYSQWEASAQSATESKKEAKIAENQTTSKATRPKKLSYKEQRELESMEYNIAEAEAKVTELQTELENPDIHSDPQKSLEAYRLLGEAQKKHETLFERWQELENKLKNV
jgi:ATP-binding cassette subfamily F protein uup